MNLVQTLREDYARFPKAQTYEIYAQDVYFQDPMNRFRGIRRYQEMITWMDTWFRAIQLDLHHIDQQDNRIRTEWTLSWTVPLPWQPRLRIRGWTEMEIDEQGRIRSHIDTWQDSKLSVVGQLFWPKPG